MAEYSPRSCDPCPHLAQFGSNPPKASDFLAQNTVPEPQVQYQQNTPQEYNLGVPTAYQSPNLHEPPTKASSIDYEPKESNFFNREEALMMHDLGGMPPCARAATERCCLNRATGQEENKIRIDCQVFNKEGDIKPLRGILKNSTTTHPASNCCCPNSSALPAFQVIKAKEEYSILPTTSTTTNQGYYQPVEGVSGTNPQQQIARMYATAGRQDPEHPENPELGSRVPVPNALRPILEENPACYLPQPEDFIMAQKIADMGPVGPWATGKADWGSLGGLTGTRPVVDKYSITRYSEGEWRAHNKEIWDYTKTEQHRAYLIDWNGRQCLEQTQADVDRNQGYNTRRLNQREMGIMRWKCELERAIALAAEEISFMEEQRRRLKQAAAVLQMPESIAGECLERRTGRLDSELVRDEVEDELIKEVALCSEIRSIFSRTLKDVEMQLLEDHTAKQRLEYDWSDKRIAHELDALNYSLNTRSTILMFKPGAVTFPENQSTPEYWEHFTKETLLAGEATRQRSVALRVQTRLDNRLQRPRVENCRDPPHFGLVEEVNTIGDNVTVFQAQLGQAEASQEQMIIIRNVLEREIMLKKKTLEIDRDQIGAVRSHYPSATALSGH
uniref:Tektin n=1 Tax=Dendroctonus ponderosae TaxID=77166 RepID=A0AAR5P4D3_DENPD